MALSPADGSGRAGVMELPAPSVDLRAVSQVLARGVAVLTAVAGDTPRGMTVSSFTPVSFYPPLMLVAVNQAGSMSAVLTTATGFGLSVLAEHQERLSRHFASRRRPAGWAQFVDVPHRITPASGALLLEGALAHFDCLTRELLPAGDHLLVIGEVVHAECRDVAPALSPITLARSAASAP